MSAEALPDELWRKILETGIGSSSFTFKDLCCLSMSCRRLHRLSGEDSFWSHLLSSDFDNSSSSSQATSIKSSYKIRFEKDRERKLAAHRRAVLRKESQVAENLRKIREIERKLREETDKMKSTVAELSNLRRVRQASVALNVWQPEVVRGKQKQIVEQCVIPVESRLHSLEMELRLCKQQIAGFDNAYREQKQRLEKAKEELGSMKYHPLREYKFTSSEDNECNLMRQKLKTNNKYTWIYLTVEIRYKNLAEQRTHTQGLS
ncbi:F-box protein SKIP24-like isoform X2 [Pistacia vera]|uniref:F-box protein SKIP24-like isoform X2 n=1 Tax=Pistacia vera TaxID=55513 RepID=UPI0012636656|nr:F-box protein SKIP24-like isoform X2 [Pistacia vera]